MGLLLPAAAVLLLVCAAMLRRAGFQWQPSSGDDDDGSGGDSGGGRNRGASDARVSASAASGATASPPSARRRTGVHASGTSSRGASVQVDEHGGAEGGMRPLRVLSHNVWAHYLVNAPARSRRLRGLVRHIVRGRYDVVCLQELFVLKLGPLALVRHFDAFARAMADAGLPFHTDPMASMPRVIGQNSGVVIFSRHPLLEVGGATFNTSVEFLNTKGYVYAIAQLPAGVMQARGTSSPGERAGAMRRDDTRNVAVMCCHMDAPTRPRYVRAAQITQVSEAAAALAARTDLNLVCAPIIAGDFNTCPRTFDDGSNYRFLLERMAPAKDVFNYPGAATCRTHKPLALVDSIKLSLFGGGVLGAGGANRDSDNDDAGVAEATAPLVGPGRVYPEPPQDGGNAFLDHIFVAAEVTVVRKAVLDWRDDQDSGVSDHYGLECELTLGS